MRIREHDKYMMYPLGAGIRGRLNITNHEKPESLHLYFDLEILHMQLPNY